VPNVSIECLEAIELLLKKDPRERITMFDFLHHPWLQNYQKWKNRKMWAGTYSSSESLSADETTNKGDHDHAHAETELEVFTFERETD
jgi:hypothetical protein